MGRKQEIHEAALITFGCGECGHEDRAVILRKDIEGGELTEFPSPDDPKWRRDWICGCKEPGFIKEEEDGQEVTS